MFTNRDVNYSSFSQDIDFLFFLSYNALSGCALINGVKFLNPKALKNELDVTFPITFKAVCLQVGQWNITEPWHLKPLQLFNSNYNPFSLSATTATLLF